MRIGIVGNGVVGHATARCYIEHHEVLVFDKAVGKGIHGFHDTVLSDIVFVCLPETELDSFFSSVRTFPYRNVNFVIKSTVPIGTTRKLIEKYGTPNIVHSPEFLTARCAVTDAQIPARNIIGYPGWNFKSGGDFDTYIAEFNEPDESCLVTLCKLYKERFPGVPYHIMKSDESEAVKLFTNAFFSIKIAYFNEINLLCKRMQLNWDTILQGMLSDGRIGSSHTKVPGPDGKYGFGGACLPKDLATLFSHISDGGVQENGWSVIGSALMRNDEDRKREST